MPSRYGRNSGGTFISDRSGFRFPNSEKVIEPGTGYVVARCENDGPWSLVSHPLSNLNYYLKGKTGDPFPIPNARPRPDTETVSHVTTHYCSVNFGNQFVLEADSIRDINPFPATQLFTGVATLTATQGVINTTSSAIFTGVASIVVAPLTTHYGYVFNLTGQSNVLDTGITKTNIGRAIMTGVANMSLTPADFLSSDWNDNDWFTDGSDTGRADLTGMAILQASASDWVSGDWSSLDWDT